MRRLITLTAALAVTMAVAAPVVAQDMAVAAPVVAQDAAEAEEPAAVGTASTMSLAWQRVELPKAGPFLWVYDIIPVGPRFIAVGGGTRVSPKSRARVWTSKNGRRWQSVPLPGPVGHGTPRAITRTPGGGFVMVGQGRCVMPCAMAWRSPDGVTWERLPEAIRESMMYDVAVFGDRLVAVGCFTPGFHCLAGRTWVSDDDGATWEQVAEVPEIMFHALEAVDGQLVATGDTDGFDTAQGVTATSPDGVAWTIHDHSDGPGWMRAAGRQGGRALVAGGDHEPSGAKVAATLLASRDDGKFEAIESKSFNKGFFVDMATAGGAILLSGVLEGKRGIIPYSVASPDLVTFTRVPFPKAARRTYGEAMAVAFSPNGARAVVGGRSGDDGAMWFSRVTR